MTSTTVTLADGRQVASDSPEWRDECLARHKDVQLMAQLRGRTYRASFLTQREALRGPVYRKRLEDDFLAHWTRTRRVANPGA